MVETDQLGFTPRMHVRSGSHFKRAYSRGSRAGGDLMTVAVVPNDLGHARPGLSSGKRVWKSAVKRNPVRISYWLPVGARPSETVASMIVKIGIEIPKPKKRARKKSKGKPKAWTPPKKKVRKKKVAEPAAEGSEQASS